MFFVGKSLTLYFLVVMFLHLQCWSEVLGCKEIGQWCGWGAGNECCRRSTCTSWTDGICKSIPVG